MIKLCNLTPHTINLVRGGQVVQTIVPSGLARVSVTTEIVGEIDGFEVRRNVYGEITGLPEAEQGTIYIVSALVAQAVKGRSDVVVPDGSVRNQDGQIVGCTGFARII